MEKGKDETDLSDPGPWGFLGFAVCCLAMAVVLITTPAGTRFRAPAIFIGIYSALGHELTVGLLFLISLFSAAKAIRLWSKGFRPGSPAGFWRRLLASLIDFLVAWVPGAVALSLISERALSNAAVSDPRAYEAMEDAMIVVGFILLWIYFATMESSRLQATIGKLAVGIRVTTITGERLSFARAALRFLGKVVASMPLYMGILMIAFTKQKRGLHDFLVKSLVVNTG